MSGRTSQYDFGQGTFIGLDIRFNVPVVVDHQ